MSTKSRFIDTSGRHVDGVDISEHVLAPEFQQFASFPPEIVGTQPCNPGVALRICKVDGIRPPIPEETFEAAYIYAKTRLQIGRPIRRMQERRSAT